MLSMDMIVDRCARLRSQLNKCNEIYLQDAEHTITRPSLPGGSEELEMEILIRAFINADANYTASLNDGSNISRCMCPYMANNHVACKHIFIIERLFGCSICFDFSDSREF